MRDAKSTDILSPNGTFPPDSADLSRIVSNDVDGLILAAGLSSRMGFPKALVEGGRSGETFLELTANSMREAGVGRITIVVGHEGEKIARLASELSLEVVFNKDYNQGQFSSLLSGLRELEKGGKHILYSLVDHPFVKSSTIAKLLERVGTMPDRANELVVIPSFMGKTGHPLFLGRLVVGKILAFDCESNLREFIKDYSMLDRVLEMTVDDEGVLLDLDTKADLKRALRAPS
jgi:molybdenum cofactor cytidylyltransferase